MLLSIVIGISFVALLALIVALITDSVLAGWFTVVASAFGLLLLIVNELRQNGRADAQAEPEESTHDEVLRPDIWPQDHAVHDTGSDADRVEPRRASDGDPLRPEIWP
jgi:uncharacterized protein (DUF58 family)